MSNYEPIFIEMLEKQYSLNAVINPEWKEANYNWKLAIIMETAELIDCFPWKWWVDKDEIDYDNIKIELVDLLHFFLSWWLQEPPTEKAKEFFFQELEAIDSKFVLDYSGAFWCAQELLRMIACPSQPSAIPCFTEYYKIVRQCGLTFNSLAKLYFGKLALNIFRQRHKEGYNKIWNGEEDNIFLLRIVSKIDLDNVEQFIEQVLSELEKEYMFVQVADEVNAQCNRR